MQDNAKAQKDIEQEDKKRLMHTFLSVGVSLAVIIGLVVIGACCYKVNKTRHAKAMQRYEKGATKKKGWYGGGSEYRSRRTTVHG